VSVRFMLGEDDRQVAKSEAAQAAL
jgi:hypothetical protein